MKKSDLLIIILALWVDGRRRLMRKRTWLLSPHHL